MGSWYEKVYLSAIEGPESLSVSNGLWVLTWQWCWREGRRGLMGEAAWKHSHLGLGGSEKRWRGEVKTVGGCSAKEHQTWDPTEKTATWEVSAQPRASSLFSEFLSSVCPFLMLGPGFSLPGILYWDSEMISGSGELRRCKPWQLWVNVCVPLKFICWNPPPCVVAFEGRVWGGHSVMMVEPLWIGWVPLIRETSGILLPFCRVQKQLENAVRQPGSGPSPDTESATSWSWTSKEEINLSCL